MTNKISSILELARYKTNELVYCVSLSCAYPLPDLTEEEAWLADAHPKELFSGPFKKLWPFYAKLPRVAHYDFDIIINLLISKLLVEEFVVGSVMRSDYTGEFLYYNEEDDDWMPEKCLFDTTAAALRERTRILRLVQQWAKCD